MTIQSENLDLITPSQPDILLADKTGKRLAALLKKRPAYPVQVVDAEQAGDALEIPAPAMHLLVEILAEMAKGRTVTLVPMREEITTQQAADLLHVSRPFFVQLLENGEIPFRKVGTRRRIKLQDVMAYKRNLFRQRLQILDELTAYDQELGLQ